MQTDEESDKMRISHVIKTDQLRSDLQIRSASHFVVSRYLANFCSVWPHAQDQRSVSHRFSVITQTEWLCMVRTCS